MSKHLVKFVAYLFISLGIGLSVVLVTYHFENILDEKNLRRTVKQEIKNAIVSFKDASPGATTEQTRHFLRKFTETTMKDKVIAVENTAGQKPARSEAKYLFTFYDGGKGTDFYIKNAYVEEEVYALDVPEIIEGMVATVLIFITLIIFTERWRRTRLLMQEQYETKHAELTKAVEENRALALLGRMTATLAHEIKTPIATISNLVQVLPERISDTRFIQRFTVLMTEELHRTQQLLDNLLLYGKEITIKDPQWIELKPFMEQLARKNGITLDSCPEASIQGDLFYMRLFFENLMRNSMQAGADRITLSIRMTSSGSNSRAEICCEDNGSGFPAETDLNGLITPFMTTRSKGAGLGLYLAQKIAQAHGGMLMLFRLVKGAGITFVLPKEKVRLYG